VSDDARRCAARTLVAIFVLLVAWSIRFTVFWLHGLRGPSNAVLTFGVFGSAADGKTIKLFAKRPPANMDNRMDCRGDWGACEYAPDHVKCEQLNVCPSWMDVAVWQCDGVVSRDGYDMDAVRVVCVEDASLEHDPRNGCVLHLDMRGPWTGWYLWEIVVWYTLAIFAAIVLAPIVVIFPAHGGSHASTAFG
jgi:hypothetical protein